MNTQDIDRIEAALAEAPEPPIETPNGLRWGGHTYANPHTAWSDYLRAWKTWAEPIVGENTALVARVRELEAENKEMADLRALRDAVIEWSCDRTPRSHPDADLLIALWRVLGDRTEPCPECDGECGEPCAPTTAAAAIASLEQWKPEAPHE